MTVSLGLLDLQPHTPKCLKKKTTITLTLSCSFRPKEYMFIKKKVFFCKCNLSRLYYIIHIYNRRSKIKSWDSQMFSDVIDLTFIGTGSIWATRLQWANFNFTLNYHFIYLRCINLLLNLRPDILSLYGPPYTTLTSAGLPIHELLL